jgi:ABC-type glutathione transport system ATPase component
MAQNELFTGNYQVPSVTDPSQTAGDIFLEALGLQTDPIWKWMGIVYLLCGVFVFTVVSVYFLKYIRQTINIGTQRFDEDEDAEEHDAAETRRHMSCQLSNQVVNVGSSGTSVISHASLPVLMAGSTQLSTSSVLPFLPANLAWRNLEYTVRVKDDEGKTIDRKLLSGVCGFARTGTMAALMGSSGAGKTTLLDVIAGRKTAGKLQGDIYLNGYPKVTATFNRSCGYVEQTDIHVGTVTVREALEFSAKPRLPGEVSEDQRRAFVNEVLHLLELNTIADH